MSRSTNCRASVERICERALREPHASAGGRAGATQVSHSCGLNLRMVEDIFRSMKSLLDTRPIYHKCDETIRGHVFCSFLALLLRRELEDRLGRKGWKLEWANLIRDLDNLVEMEVTIGGKGYVFRGQTPGEAGKVFQACSVALPPMLRPC
jgi:hypothetical protein